MRLALPLLLLSGCTLAEPPTCEDDDSTACFTGAMRGLLGERMEGVELCPIDLEVDCVVSDKDGTWKMPGLPLDTDVALTATHEGTVSSVFPQNTSMDWYSWFKVMVPENIMNTNASNLDQELDPTRGHILFIVWEGLNIDGVDTKTIPDVTAEVVSGEADIFYASSLGLASKSAEATTSSGSGGVLNLEPGTHEVRFDAPGGDCVEPMFHWSYSGDNVIPVPVLAGHTTAIDVMCPPVD